MRLIALERVYYDGREREEGEEFDTHLDTHAEALVLIGKARHAEIKQKPEFTNVPDNPPPLTLNKQMTASNDEREKEAEARESEPVKSKRYTRRDLRSQE
jgi:hypothetical protein